MTNRRCLRRRADADLDQLQQAVVVVDATTTTRFAHGPDRARTVQTRVQGATTTTIVYVAGLFEQLGKTGEATKFVHYIFAGSQRIAIRTTDNAPSPGDKLRYLHRDHLGSVDTITDAAGAVVERLSYDAFGKRRVAAGESAWTDPALAIAAVNTPRGFTGHEHLDDFQLVHMNGRVYDPALGRFMSADPFVQFPESTQGLNRYSYAANNPLSFTDPSGYFIGKLFKVFRNFFRKMLSVPIFRSIANIAIGIYCGPAAPACIAGGSALLAAASGGDIGDIFRAAAVAYVSAVATQAIGQEFGNPEIFTADHLGKTIAHGTVGGFIAKASGGSFKHGFLGAGAGQLGAPAINSLTSVGARVAAAAVVGGTASKLGGGKFANGAVAGAFARLYGESAATRRRGSPVPRKPSPLPGEAIDALDPYFYGGYDIYPEFVASYDLHDIRVREGIPWYVVGDPAAYTSGNDIYFAPGKYDPTTASGLALIGHEALHAQQYQELGTFQFRVSYLGEYLGGRLSGLSRRNAYGGISFERDAYALQGRIKQDLERRGYPP